MKRIGLVIVMAACGGNAAQVPDQRDVRAAGGSATAATPARLDTPDALAKALLAALVSADPARVRALYMTPEHVAALVTCERDPVAELREHIAEVEGKLQPVTSKISYDGWLENGRSVMKSGTQRDGCTAKIDFELATGSIKYTMTSDQGVQPDSKLVAIVKVDDGWRVWKLSKF